MKLINYLNSKNLFLAKSLLRSALQLSRGIDDGRARVKLNPNKYGMPVELRYFPTLLIGRMQNPCYDAGNLTVLGLISVENRETKGARTTASLEKNWERQWHPSFH